MEIEVPSISYHFGFIINSAKFSSLKMNGNRAIMKLEIGLAY